MDFSRFLVTKSVKNLIVKFFLESRESESLTDNPFTFGSLIGREGEEKRNRKKKEKEILNPESV